MYVGALLILAVVVYLLTKRKPEKPRVPDKTKRDEPIIGSGAVIGSYVPSLKNDEVVTIIKNGEKIQGKAKVMAQGTQIFDEKGNIVMNITDRLAKYCGCFDAVTLSGSIIDSEIEGREVWFAYTCNPTDSLVQALQLKELHFQISYIYPELTVNGATISWEFHEVKYPFYAGGGGSLKMDKVVPDLRVKIFYGVY